MTTEPKKLTPAQLHTLRDLVDQHNEGIEFEGAPFFLTASGKRARLLDAWCSAGLVFCETVAHRDDHSREAIGYGLTDDGIAQARLHRMRVLRMPGTGPVTHELKTHPVPFDAVLSGDKTFEIRRDDRGFEVGDVLNLREWDPARGTHGIYTGRQCKARVTYIARDAWGLPAGLVVMSIVVVAR